jgi:hypothetical protein
MNSTALVAVMKTAGFTLIHLVNLFTAMKMHVNPPLAFLIGPNRSNPHVDKGQVIIWSGANATTRIFGEQKTGNLTAMNQGVGN